MDNKKSAEKFDQTNGVKVVDLSSCDSQNESINAILDKFKNVKVEVSLEHGMDISK